VNAEARSTAVPPDAFGITSARTFGEPAVPDAAADNAHLLFHLGCKAGVMAIVTTREQLFAEIPCDRAVSQQVVERFLGKPVQIRVAPAAPNREVKIYVESATAGSIEFTATNAWVIE
jgi:hypothetical protein